MTGLTNHPEYETSGKVGCDRNPFFLSAKAERQLLQLSSFSGNFFEGNAVAKMMAEYEKTFRDIKHMDPMPRHDDPVVTELSKGFLGRAHLWSCP